MNGKTIKKKLSKFHKDRPGGRAVTVTVTLRAKAASLFGQSPPMPQKPEGWEDNLYVLAGWRRTLPHPEGGYETQIVEFGEDNGVIFGGCRKAQHGDPDRLPDEWDLTELPNDLKEVYRARISWEKKFLSGVPQTGIPVLDAMHAAGKFSQGSYPAIHGEYLYFTYPVDLNLRVRKLRFCAALHKAFSLSKKDGISLLLLKGF